MIGRYGAALGLLLFGGTHGALARGSDLTPFEVGQDRAAGLVP